MDELIDSQTDIHLPIFIYSAIAEHEGEIIMGLGCIMYSKVLKWVA